MTSSLSPPLPGLPTLPPGPASEMALARGAPSRDDAWAACAALLRRDLRLVQRRRTDTLAALVFFVIVVSLFPLAIGPEPALLRTLAPGVVWVAALLACMLSLGRLFADDHRDGTLEQLLLSPCPLPLLVLAKVAAHWLCAGLLLVAIAPLLAVQFDLSAPALAVLLASLLLGTPVLSLVGAIGAALTLGVRGAGVLLCLLVLPLCVPVLVFGAAAVQAAELGLPVGGHLSLLAAMSLMSALLAPWAVAAALRIALE